MTYMIPGYTEYYEEDGALYISSKLLQNKVKITEPKLQEEFYEILRCGGCAALSTPLTQFLHEQELLADRKEVETLLQHAKRMMDECLFVTIMPTEGCNFRCSYCYESHRPLSMHRETLDQIQTYLVDQALRFQNLHLNWFGGEPTLCKDIILETCALVQEAQASHPFRYSGGMTTNGYLLDEDAFRQYYAAGITDYQVTLDGWNHDETRPHASGKGTLQTILNNLIVLSALPKDQFPFRMVIRHNILAGDRDFSWYDHLHDLFGGDDRFSVYVSPVGDWGGESVKTFWRESRRQDFRWSTWHIWTRLACAGKTRTRNRSRRSAMQAIPTAWSFEPTEKLRSVRWPWTIRKTCWGGWTRSRELYWTKRSTSCGPLAS